MSVGVTPTQFIPHVCAMDLYHNRYCRSPKSFETLKFNKLIGKATPGLFVFLWCIKSSYSVVRGLRIVMHVYGNGNGVVRGGKLKTEKKAKGPTVPSVFWPHSVCARGTSLSDRLIGRGGWTDLNTRQKRPETGYVRKLCGGREDERKSRTKRRAGSIYSGDIYVDRLFFQPSRNRACAPRALVLCRFSVAPGIIIIIIIRGRLACYIMDECHRDICSLCFRTSDRYVDSWRPGS